MTINKKTLLRIANEYGSPVYVYDAHKMEAQYKRLTAAFSNVNKLKINYAAKALTNISVLKFINKLGAGLDTHDWLVLGLNYLRKFLKLIFDFFEIR